MLFCYDHALLWVMVIVYNNIFISQISLFDKIQIWTLFWHCGFFFLCVSLLVFETPKYGSTMWKCLESYKSEIKHEVFLSFISTEHLLLRKLMFESKKVMLSVQTCKCLYSLLYSLAHGKKKKDPTRWFSPCSLGIPPEGVRTLFKSQALGPWVFCS